MAIDILCKSELVGILTGLVVTAVETSGAGGHQNVEHLRGSVTMARSVALSCGLSWPGVVAGVRSAVGPVAVLDQVGQLVGQR